ncbi:polyprotein-like [Trifolium medium]|uniref:Polyprotein-like n=1 Tax=Trifolium medium TaxID=97028 RepID=A0A392P4C6_9FABA|nr:polyprotein-like [Trifolium medium]
MDFITNLPSSSNKTVIWAMVDCLTKYADFIALPTHVTAASLASVFLSEIHCLHGKPKTIIEPQVEFLVQWEGQISAEASWESKDTFVADFPEFDLEGKICVGDMSNESITVDLLLLYYKTSYISQILCFS